jgi:hypothetical protein
MSIVDGCRTLLSAPMLQEGESIGAIALRRAEVHPFSDKQIALLQTFADQAVIAIGNVRLFEQVRERTKELSQSLDDLRTAQDRSYKLRSWRRSVSSPPALRTRSRTRSISSITFLRCWWSWSTNWARCSSPHRWTTGHARRSTN